MKISTAAFIPSIALLLLAGPSLHGQPETAAPAVPQHQIEICSENPAYWTLDGDPVLLIGGSVEDNLFQIPNLEEHLDLLGSVGGNFVRNTMSCRDEGNIWPFFQREDGLYDLDRWNDEFWRRFEELLRLTAERDIIVQIEVWATFDYYRTEWARNPFNPRNNINYTEEESGLPTVVDNHPLGLGNSFFWSVPIEHNQTIVLEHQRRFVDQILSHTLRYGHVLYCMDNETAVTPEWGRHWSEHIQARASEAGTVAHTTEMWDPWNLDDPKHSATFDHPEIYSFVDISQNNHQTGQRHWDNAQRQRERIADQRRPLNNVKIYGADGGSFGSSRDGVERFWRNIIGGMASARFHRPGDPARPSGLGLGELAQANIRSARMLTDAMDIFSCEPNGDLMADRESNEAYCTADPGRDYAVYFPDGGEIALDLSAMDGPATVRWLDIMHSAWGEPVSVQGGDMIDLSCPGQGHWAALVQRSD